MNRLQRSLIIKAKKRHGTIVPVGGMSLHCSKSFQIIRVNGKRTACFWYDDTIRSTHVITETIGGNNG